MDPDNLTRASCRVCKAVGASYRLHDLRHHHITYLLENGVPVKDVQERAGNRARSGLYASRPRGAYLAYVLRSRSASGQIRRNVEATSRTQPRMCGRERWDSAALAADSRADTI